MSGVNRNISADIQEDGPASMATYKAAFTPENIRAEKGTAEEAKSE